MQFIMPLVGGNIKANHHQQNKFFWWNGLHPEVQDFMNKLILKVMNNYNIDGLQGDKRLPTMRGEGVYEEVIKNIYAAERMGVLPLAN